MTSCGGFRRPNPVYSPEYRAMVSVLIAVRREARISQRALARRLGKAQSHICMIERGQRRVDTLELVLIARAIGAPPEDLFARILQAVGSIPASVEGARRASS